MTDWDEDDDATAAAEAASHVPVVKAKASFSAKRVGAGGPTPLHKSVVAANDAAAADGEASGQPKAKPATVPRKGKARVAAPAPIASANAPSAQQEDGATAGASAGDSDEGAAGARRDSFDF